MSDSSATIPPLSAWNPLSHLRLLIWLLWSPQQLSAYEQFHGVAPHKTPTAAWLASTLAWLPLFLLYLAAVLSIVPTRFRFEPPALLVILCLWLVTALVDQRLSRLDSNSMARITAGSIAGIVAIFITGGVTVFAASGVLIGAAIGAIRLVCLVSMQKS